MKSRININMNKNMNIKNNNIIESIEMMIKLYNNMNNNIKLNYYFIN